jgi:hypothetical protein
VCLSSGEAEEGRDEAELPLDFTLADPFCLSLPDHVYCLVTGGRLLFRKHLSHASDKMSKSLPILIKAALRPLPSRLYPEPPCTLAPVPQGAPLAFRRFAKELGLNLPGHS